MLSLIVYAVTKYPSDSVHNQGPEYVPNKVS